mgnify:FL=1
MSEAATAPVIVISDFTGDPLVQAMARHLGPGRVTAAPFNQVPQSLAAASTADHELVVVWTTAAGA